MKLGMIAFAAACVVTLAGPAKATAPAMFGTGFGASDADVYGFVVNTDGGTFDAVALIFAVRASNDIVFRSMHEGASVAHLGPLRD